MNKSSQQSRGQRMKASKKSDTLAVRTGVNTTALHATNGDDYFMRQPPVSESSMLTLNGQMAVARMVWDRMRPDTLANSEDHPHRLLGLIQGRHTSSGDEGGEAENAFHDFKDCYFR